MGIQVPCVCPPQSFLGVEFLPWELLHASVTHQRQSCQDGRSVQRGRSAQSPWCRVPGPQGWHEGHTCYLWEGPESTLETQQSAASVTGALLCSHPPPCISPEALSQSRLPCYQSLSENKGLLEESLADDSSCSGIFPASMNCHVRPICLRTSEEAGTYQQLHCSRR